MATLTKAKRERYFRWLKYQIFMPAFFVIVTYLALLLFSVGDAFVQTFAGSDLLLLSGLVVSRVYDDMVKCGKTMKYAFIPREGTSDFVFLLSLALFLAYVLIKVRLAVSITPIQANGANLQSSYSYVPTPDSGGAFLTLTIILLIMAGNIKLKLLLSE